MFFLQSSLHHARWQNAKQDFCTYVFYLLFFGPDAATAAPQEYSRAVEEEEEESPNYEEKAQEIVQSILQEVVNTVAGGELPDVISLHFFPQCSCPHDKLSNLLHNPFKPTF